MAIYRGYEVDSLGISIGGTSATPALYILPTTTSDANILRVKCAIEAASSPAPPSNGSVLFTLSKVTGTVGGGASVTAQPTGPSSLAANTTFKSGSTSLTGLTQGVELYAAVVPFTSGAWSEDTFENTGLEIYLPAGTAAYCVYFQAASGAGSGCNARVILNFAE